MKLYVKRVNTKDTGFTLCVSNKDTVADLKERIGGILDLLPDAMRLLHRGHPLSKSEATLESYGIEDNSRINVVYFPSIDMKSGVSRILTSLLHERCPANLLPVIVEKYQSVAKRVKSFSLEELERYAKFRNQHIK